jgi:hypothetical protein
MKQEKLLAVARRSRPTNSPRSKSARRSRRGSTVSRAAVPPAEKIPRALAGSASPRRSRGAGEARRVREETPRVERVAYTDDFAHGELVAAQPHALNAEQAAAVAALAASLAAENSACRCCTASPARARPRSTCAPSTRCCGGRRRDLSRARGGAHAADRGAAARRARGDRARTTGVSSGTAT